jgi:hypothetical protein
MSLSFTGNHTKTVTVTNTGSANLAMTSAAIIPYGPFSIRSGTDTCSGNTLAPSMSCTIGVKFKRPYERNGRFDAALTITDGICGSPQTVSLTGRKSGARK